MINRFEKELSGGHPNSLGNTIAVVEEILQDRAKFDDLYQCYFSEDEVVRLRVSNAMKRVCRVHPEWFEPYLDRFIGKISNIDQPSTQWTFAQLMQMLDDRLSEKQREDVKRILKANLEKSDDWIVLNFTMEVLSGYAMTDDELKHWLLPRLEKLQQDSRKSVAKRAHNYFLELN